MEPFLQYKQLSEAKSQFPTVTICNYDLRNMQNKPLVVWFKHKALISEWENHFDSYQYLAYGDATDLIAAEI